MVSTISNLSNKVLFVAVVKTTVLLADIADFATMNQIYSEGMYS